MHVGSASELCDGEADEGLRVRGPFPDVRGPHVARRAGLAAGVLGGRPHAGDFVVARARGVVDREPGLPHQVAVGLVLFAERLVLRDLIVEQGDVELLRHQLGRPGHFRFQDADGFRFVGRVEDDAAIFDDQMLRRLAHFPAEDDVEFVELLREIAERGLVGKGEEDHVIGLAAEAREQLFQRGVHRLDRDAFAGAVAAAAAVDHADDRDPAAVVFHDAVRLEQPRAGRGVEHVRADHRDRRARLQRAQLRRGELRLALADVQRRVAHARKGALHVAVLEQLIVGGPFDGVADIDQQRPRSRLRRRASLEPREPAVLAGETAARLDAAIRVAREGERERRGRAALGASRRPARRARAAAMTNDE